jgi:transcriptional regulator with XRE-family HTH domain
VDRVRIGNTFRAIRLELRLRQADVGARSGVSQQTISDVECGMFGSLSVNTYCRIAAALNADIPLAPRWRGARLDRILDRRHAELQNRTVELLTSLGWQVATEVPFNRYGDRGSVDILGWRPEARALLIVEIKSEIASLEETLRILNMKRRVLPAEMRRERSWDARYVARSSCFPMPRPTVAWSSATRPWSRRRCRSGAGTCADGSPSRPATCAGWRSCQIRVTAVLCGRCHRTGEYGRRRPRFLH